MAVLPLLLGWVDPAAPRSTGRTYKADVGGSKPSAPCGSTAGGMTAGVTFAEGEWMSVPAASMHSVSAKRPKVPSELRRRVLIEAGHRCAIPACKATPVEIAHIVPWSKVRRHEFKNLIALCPTCHTRFDDPHGPIDLKAMRQYKANLNPLLSGDLGNREGQAARLAAYQEFRARFADWFSVEAKHAAVKSRRSSSSQEVADLRTRAVDRFAWMLCAVLDFQSTWKESEACDLVGAVFYHAVYWSDEVHDTAFPIPKDLAHRDIAAEIAEVSAELHLTVCEELAL